MKTPGREGTPMRWFLPASLLPVLLAAYCAWPDSITVGGATYTNVKIHESDARYYFTLPDGKVMSVSKSDVKPEDVIIERRPPKKATPQVPATPTPPAPAPPSSKPQTPPFAAKGQPAGTQGQPAQTQGPPAGTQGQPAQTQGPRREPVFPLARGMELTVSNDAGIPDIPDYDCGSFSQRIVLKGKNTITLRIEAAEGNPATRQGYPIENVPEEMRPYLAPTPHIQSDDAGIKAAARTILESTRPRLAHELVEAVCAYASKRMQYGLSNEVPDAVLCLNRRLGNCIGYTHLSAALLRALGIPCRTVRVYVACDCGHLHRHSMIEVYYPEDQLWVMYEPQSGGHPPPPQLIYAYNDPDWNQPLQRVVWNFSNDAKTHVRITKTWGTQGITFGR